MNDNWEWVRSTYGQAVSPRSIVVEESFHYPSCLSNGLSLRQKKALLQVYYAAHQRAETLLRRLGRH